MINSLYCFYIEPDFVKYSVWFCLVSWFAFVLYCTVAEFKRKTVLGVRIFLLALLIPSIISLWFIYLTIPQKNVALDTLDHIETIIEDGSLNI